MYGTIYLIKHKTEDVYYIGSTVRRLSDRWSHHKTSYRRWLKDGMRYCTIFREFQRFGGTDQFVCQKIISYYDLPDLETLLNIENYYISLYKKKYNCVNKTVPCREYRDIMDWI